MKRKILVLILFILFACGPSNSKTKSEPTRLHNSLVWQITGPNIHEPSYLVGTMHIMCKKDFVIKDKVIQIMNTAEQLFLENDLDDPSVLMALQKALIVEEPLKSRLNEIEYTKLSKLLNTYDGININMFDTSHPAAIQSSILINQIACEEVKSMEVELMMMAQAKGIKVWGLDSAQDFKKTTDEVFTSIASNADLSIYKNIKNSFNELLHLYQTENITKLNLTLEKQMNVYPQKEKMLTALFDRRNQNWVKIISTTANQKPTVFAFGAGHLAGEQGVISLLRKLGLTITPIMD